ncbi:WG repeat-containing protein [Enterovibrio norvegicus]|uniref:WG repeat-containing protein n=1 Tax=Enterovibrio norvegicus TaxID=188144 RepID=UPI000C844C62|nr:WG repeat-containing protein [Enterovibrio norvegicus]PMN69391.1 hypothetical protein BCT27_20725 [Enterovibrio norvegicus]
MSKRKTNPKFIWILLKCLILSYSALFIANASAKDPDTLKIIEVPFYKDLTIDLPIDAELRPWESGIYFWYIQKLQLTPEKDKVFKVAPYNLDVVISEAPQSDFDYAKWRKSLAEDGVEIIDEVPEGVLYSSANVLHILTYYHTGQEHVLGKATLFDTEDLVKARTMFEVLQSFTPNTKQRKFTAPFNIVNELQTKEIPQDNPLADELSALIQKNLTKKRLLDADTLDGFWGKISAFNETIEIFPELETDTLDKFADEADQYGWDIRFHQAYLPGKQAGSMVMQSQVNPMSFITYCLFQDSDLNLLVSIPSTVSVTNQLEFVHQCNHLTAAQSLPWMTPQWHSKLFYYKRVKPVDEPEGWFTVFDDNDNPDDYFFGAVGVLDAEGNLVIPNRFEEIEWTDGYFVGQSKLGKELLSKSGESLMIAENFRHIDNNLYFVWEEDNQQGVFDLKNNAWIIPLAEHYIEKLDDSDLFTFRKVSKSTSMSVSYGKVGLMNREGAVLLKNEYDHFWLNTHLNVIVAQQRTVSGSRATSRFGIFDMKGEQLVPFQYDRVLNVREAIINLRKDELWYQYSVQ